MIDDDLEGLKKAFMSDKTNSEEQCPMSDQLTDYAFGELNTGEGLKVREHIQTCRQCLELYMDLRLAEEETKQVKDEKVDVLPGLQRAIDKSKKPEASIFEYIKGMIPDWEDTTDLMSKYFTPAFDPCELFSLAPDYPDVIKITLQGRRPAGLRGGQPEYKKFEIQSGETLNSGDLFRFQFKIDNDVFIYIIFQDSLGSIRALEKGFMKGETDVFLPDETKWYKLGENTGTERLHSGMHF